MRRELILSNLRIELRRKQASYLSEKRAVSLVNDFLENMSIVHSSQIRRWQKDYFLSEMERSSERTKDEFLQAKSTLTFLFNIVLKKGRGIDVNGYDDENGGDPGVFKITG